MPAPQVLIVGAGIAGACAAFYARQAGAEVTLIDAADGTASHVPTALVNPVRGLTGKVVKDGFEACRFTFALVDALIAAGHAVTHGRGLFRPVPDAATQASWHQQLPEDAPAQWVPVDPSLGLSGIWYSALWLPEAGWIDTRSMLDALLSHSQASILRGEVIHVDQAARQVTLASQAIIGYETLLWCGGARGAALAGPGLHTYRPGSVLVLETPLADDAMSYGLYAAPAAGGAGVVGSTSEPRANRYDGDGNQWALDRLKARVDAMWHQVPAMTGSFRGVRLGRNVAAALPSLDGFGSRGYLLAPRAAFDWARATFAAAERH